MKLTADRNEAPPKKKKKLKRKSKEKSQKQIQSPQRKHLLVDKVPPHINRVIHAQKERLTPFDLRAQIFRVNVNLSVYYRGQFFFEKMSESDLSSRKKFPFF